jgi:phosphotransferase system  glucose/maltose/N-acetylglucosamine-specific IIC component
MKINCLLKIEYLDWCVKMIYIFIIVLIVLVFLTIFFKISSEQRENELQQKRKYFDN